MKDINVISINKSISLTDLNIRPTEICWGKVKMTSSRWITCCHQRMVQHTPPMATYHHLKHSDHNHHHHNNHNNHYHHPNNHTHRRESPTFVHPSVPVHNNLNTPPSRHHHQHHNHNHNHHHNSTRQNGKNPFPNGAISSSYQTPSQRREPNGLLPSSMSSTNSHLTPSNSPMSSSSLYDLGRKSSSSSSSSSNNSFTMYHHSSMKHSRSTVDLPSSGHHHLRHHQHYRPRDDSMMMSMMMTTTSSSFENTITIISPLDGILINCQTNGDSICAQISPQLNVIAVSNDHWIAFYSIKTNECLGTLQFPSRCTYWTWIRPDAVAVITENDVHHWSLTVKERDTIYIQNGDLLRFIFSIDNDIKQNQIIDYRVDPLFSNWCALTTLFVDDDGEIGGKIQIYSHSYGQSQCIESHSCAFASYQFDDSEHCSTLLITAKRQKDSSWKLHIIELGPIPNGNLTHKSINQILTAHTERYGANVRGQTEDIPTQIVCDNQIGLIYLLSKYGSFYICDLQTGVPLYYDSISDWTDGQAIFSFAYDSTTDSLVAICRNGQVLTIQLSLTALIRDSDTWKAPKAWERIGNKLKQVKGIVLNRVNGDESHHDSHYLSVNSFDSSGSTNSSASLIIKPNTYHFGQRTPEDDYSSIGSFYQSQTDKSNCNLDKLNHINDKSGEPSKIDEDDDEQITRL